MPKTTAALLSPTFEVVTILAFGRTGRAAETVLVRRADGSTLHASIDDLCPEKI